MADCSSESSADEDEILQHFDAEAKLIVTKDTLPKKSSDRYMLVYHTCKKFLKDNENSLSKSDENNLIVYFHHLKNKLKPPTLWSVWSMLRKTLNTNENIDINHFLNWKSLIKNNSKGYKPKKAFSLKWNEIMQFMTHALDHTYLAMKVILVFGICGALRCDEITNMKVQDIEDLGNRSFLVTIQENKNDYPGQFLIGTLFYDIVQRYMALRPAGEFSDRFFIQYHNGKCIRQPIGRHKIGEVPQQIASYLKLSKSERYTGHSFRRTAATLLSESGANMQTIKQLGRWRSDIIAQGYVENSVHNRQMIFDGIIHESKKSTQVINIERPTSSANVMVEQPSTSGTVLYSQNPTENTIAPKSAGVIPPKTPKIGLLKKATDNIAQKKPTVIPTSTQYENLDLDFNLDWNDFVDEMTVHNLKPMLEESFSTASKKQIIVPPIENKCSFNTNNRKFITKSPVKLVFNNQDDVNDSARKKMKTREEGNENNNIIHSILDKHGLNFEHATFNNCVFNITINKCNDKE